MINPKNKLFTWGPIEGRPIYNIFYWYRGFVGCTKRFPPGWAGFITYFQEEKFWAIADHKQLYDKGEAVFKKYLLNERQFKKNWAEWEKMLISFLAIKKEITAKTKLRLNKDELADLIIRWNKIYADDFWNIGSLPELANWGGEQLLGSELKKRLKNHPDFYLAMERLAAPEDFSFYQKEELDLLKLKAVKNKKQQAEKLAEHQQKYFWLLNSYYGTKVLPVSYFRKALSAVSAKQAIDKIRRIKALRRQAVKQKMAVIKKFGLPKNILEIARRLAFSVWWQDLRKSYIFQANQLIDLLLTKAAKIFKIDFNELHHYSLNELENLVLRNKKVSPAEIIKRQNNFYVYLDPKKYKETHFSGETAEKLARPYIERKVDANLKEFKGLVVNRGKVKGRVRVLFSPGQAKRMKPGEILVAPMTSPEYIVALRKAAAVVTDEGGMTCHAAIVSRELGIPGIVGTKIATKVLHDGDLVEVDADKGIVNIIK